MKIVPIIPSLNPDYKLEGLVDELIRNDFKIIIIVNDGSSDSEIFDKLNERDECVILTHDINKGKRRMCFKDVSVVNCGKLG